jgi:ribosomal protein L37AE/L43A
MACDTNSKGEVAGSPVACSGRKSQVIPDTQITHKPKGGKNMCSVGDVTNVDVSRLTPDEYECMDCNNKFKGLGKRVTCPSCRSSNVKKID